MKEFQPNAEIISFAQFKLDKMKDSLLPKEEDAIIYDLATYRQIKDKIQARKKLP